MGLVARWLAILMLSISAAAQALPVAAIKVAGNVRLPAPAIAQAAGIHQGQTIALADLETAARALFDTGLFTAVNYRYDSVPGTDPPTYTITFQLTEDSADTDVRIEIPGIDEGAIWNALAASDPLVTRRMPHNDRAGEFYCRAVERALVKLNRHERIVVAESVALGSRRMDTTLVPANPPKVADVRFEGTHALAASVLHDAVTRIVLGNRYSEREFRQVLDLDVRPLYEDRGYLKVDFPAIRLTPVGTDLAVAVQVTEGSPWTLGVIALAGDRLPDESMRKAAALWDVRIANWKLILESVERMEKVLRKDGYLNVTARPVRLFREDGRTVDLRIEFTKGPQFVVGALTIGGLNSRDQQRAQSLFRLKPGEPLDQPYLEDYVKQCLDFLGNSVKSFDSKMTLRPGTTTMDLTLTFK
jgi:outer membrane protein insertion porin family